MAGGPIVFNGAAACGPSVKFGTVIELPQEFLQHGVAALNPNGAVVCLDRGTAVGDLNVDVALLLPEGREEQALALAYSWGIRRQLVWQYKSEKHRQDFIKWEKKHEDQ